MKYQTQLTLPVELTFEVLPELSVNGAHLPAQLNLAKAVLTIVGPSGKPRQVDITKTLSEEQEMFFEDEFLDSYFEGDEP